MRRLSISTRLALWYGLSLMLLLGVFAAFLYTGFHLSLHRDFDTDLAREAQRLAAALPTDPPLTSFEQAAEASPYAVQLLDATGAVRFANGRLPGVSLPPPPDGEASFRTHDDVRTRYEPIRGGQGELRAWVAVAGVESGLHREMHRLRWLLVVGVVFGVAIAALSGYALASRALRPVAALTAAAGRIGPGERGARLPAEEGPGDELGDLADAFNALLARLDDAFERERRFRADAAHELLTPVTAARSEVDVVLRRDRDPEAYRKALRAIGGHVDRMTDLISGLLALSRAEAAGHGPVHVEPTELAAVARTLVERMKPVARSKGVELTLRLEGAGRTAVPRAPVETALENLINNALKYTLSGGKVDVVVRSEDGHAIASVTDTGVGFTEAERDRLFGRFYRADAPEVRRERGSGLGLAIAQRLVERYGGVLTAASPGPGQGSVFELRLPEAVRGGAATESHDRTRVG
jgi:signal transduction histidine kinase